MTTDGDAEKLKGSGKEGVGNLTGNEQTEAEGTADQLKGDAKDLAHYVKDRFTDAKDKVADLVKKATG